jgi:ubiquinol-cytochrome c reductase cytochrome c subunit
MLIRFVIAVVIAAAVVVHAAASQTAPSSQPATVPAGDVEKGKLLFTRNGCYQCHNYEGHGGAAGARLAPNPIPFRAFVTYVRAPKGDMPPYTIKIMSEQDLADVYAFLRSRPRPPAASSLPLLR